MASNDASTRARVERTGLGMMEVENGLSCLGSLLQASSNERPGVLAAVPIRWERFLTLQYNGRVPAVFKDFEDVLENSEIKNEKRRASKKRHISSKGDATKVEFMLSEVNEVLNAVLGSEVDPSQPLMAAGLDSLGAVEFRNNLEARLGMELPGTLIFDYPTPASLAVFLISKVQADVDESDHSSEFASPKPLQRHDYDINGAGMAVILDASLRSPSNSMINIYPVDASKIIPNCRWDVDSHTGLFGGLPVRFGPTLEGVELFDPTSMGIPEAEAVLMDPQQRLLLELTAELFLSYGGLDSSLNSGVFVGLSSTDYAKVSLITRLFKL